MRLAYPILQSGHCLIVMHLAGIAGRHLVFTENTSEEAVQYHGGRCEESHESKLSPWHDFSFSLLLFLQFRVTCPWSYLDRWHMLHLGMLAFALHLSLDSIVLPSYRTLCLGADCNGQQGGNPRKHTCGAQRGGCEAIYFSARREGKHAILLC